MTNFGVEPFLDALRRAGAAAAAAHDHDRAVCRRRRRASPASSSRSRRTWIRSHRDRIAFVRICSGRFARGMEVKHVRTGKTLDAVALAAVHGAGAHHGRRGLLRRHRRAVGSGRPAHRRQPVRGRAVRVRGHPALLARALRARAARRSAASASSSRRGSTSSPRRARCSSSSIASGSSATRSSARSACCSSRSSSTACWPSTVSASSSIGCPTATRAGSRGSEARPRQVRAPRLETCVFDVEGRPLVLFETEWLMHRAEEDDPSFKFISAVQPGRSVRAA